MTEMQTFKPAAIPQSLQTDVSHYKSSPLPLYLCVLREAIAVDCNFYNYKTSGVIGRLYRTGSKPAKTSKQIHVEIEQEATTMHATSKQASKQTSKQVSKQKSDMQTSKQPAKKKHLPEFKHYSVIPVQTQKLLS